MSWAHSTNLRNDSTSKQTTTMKPQELQNVIEIRKALIEQGKHLNFDYLESAYQWVIDAPEKEEREDRLFAAVQAFNTKKHYKDVFDWIFKGVFKE